jgi:hypothetical protein
VNIQAWIFGQFELKSLLKTWIYWHRFRIFLNLFTSPYHKAENSLMALVIRRKLINWGEV